MIWQEVADNSIVEKWYEEIVESRMAPPSYSLEPPADTYSDLSAILSAPLTVRIWPGGVEVTITTNHGKDSLYAQEVLMQNVYRILENCDGRREVYQWKDLAEEEFPAPHVRQQLFTTIEGINAVGPGGRVIVQRLLSNLRASIAVRRTDVPIEGSWVHPSAMRARLETAMTRVPRDVRIRIGFGYHELSLYGFQTILHPAIVVIADRHEAVEGPRWRVVQAERATTFADGDDGDASDDRLVDVCQ